MVTSSTANDNNNEDPIISKIGYGYLINKIYSLKVISLIIYQMVNVKLMLSKVKNHPMIQQ